MTRSEFLYEIIDIKNEHKVTNDQALYLLATHCGINWDLPQADDILAFVTKRLIKPGGKINEKVLFRTREGEQQSLELFTESTPKGSEESLERAHLLEKKLVPDAYLTEEYRKTVADKHFKGDISVARYFIIFLCMFPVKDKKDNKKWNTHFGITFDETSRKDTSPKVTKKFHELYTKKDMGLLLLGTYFYIKDSINFDMETSYCTKPYKFLCAYSDWYDMAKDKLEKSKVKEVKEDTKETNRKGSSTSL